ncbi:MAG: hypothetical protein KVP17_003489 [Porospora cf. gigantea B]|uniref:uncharacterized protein n=1 Tax=Porospora cf. gigantea B TaxID=2853592 RepID=UPI003571ED2F|nr:MAG: hypothetical protein KVP17_003489 [Porospora cf. gigantea B]
MSRRVDEWVLLDDVDSFKRMARKEPPAAPQAGNPLHRAAQEVDSLVAQWRLFGVQSEASIDEKDLSDKWIAGCANYGPMFEGIGRAPIRKRF